MKLKYLCCLLVILLAFFVLFYRLGCPTIFIWDEAIYANNALEMAISHDFWVLKSNGLPTLYNTKPPLVIWLQTLFIWLLEPNEWAIRLPSAIASLIVCVGLFVFANKVLRNTLAGLLSIVILISTYGFIAEHGARSGDLDAILSCLITFYALWSFYYLLKEPQDYKFHFTIIAAGVLLAFLAKSIAGFMPLLGLFIGSIFIGKIGSVLKIRYLYIVVFSVISLSIGYYLFREYLSQGYIDKVIFSEYRRFNENIMPWHEHPYDYYWTVMTEYKNFHFFVYFLPFAWLLGIIDKRYRQFTILNACFCLSYFLLISYPSIKLPWYLMPLYPFFAISIGLGYTVVIDIAKKISGQNNSINMFFYCHFCLLLLLPFYSSLCCCKYY